MCVCVCVCVCVFVCVSVCLGVCFLLVKLKRENLLDAMTVSEINGINEINGIGNGGKWILM